MWSMAVVRVYVPWGGVRWGDGNWIGEDIPLLMMGSLRGAGPEVRSLAKGSSR